MFGRGAGLVCALNARKIKAIKLIPINWLNIRFESDVSAAQSMWSFVLFVLFFFVPLSFDERIRSSSMTASVHRMFYVEFLRNATTADVVDAIEIVYRYYIYDKKLPYTH